MADFPVYYPFYNFENEGIRNNLFYIYIDTTNIIFNDDAYRTYLKMRARSAPALSYNIATQTYTFMNQEATYGVGIRNIGENDMTIQFMESYSPVNVRKLFEDWRNLAVDNEFNMNFKKFYTTDVQIEYLYPDGTVFRTVVIKNAFVTDTGQYTLKWNKDAGLLNLSVTFRYDYFIVKK